MRHKTSKFLMPRTSETGKVLFGSGLVLAGLLLSTSLVPAQETKQDMDGAAPQEQLRPLVSVVERGSSQENIQLKVFGVAKAHYRQTLVTEVSGRIIELSPRLEPGIRLKQGETLARIEEDSLAIPEHQVAVVVAVAGGHLAGGAQDNEFAGRQGEPRDWTTDVIKPIVPADGARGKR